MDGHTFVRAALILAVFNLAIWCSIAKSFNVSPIIFLRLRYVSGHFECTCMKNYPFRRASARYIFLYTAILLHTVGHTTCNSNGF